ncbi:MAG TPA: helix-turn-helix domain-containing protein [Candidatus Polarisedimenticolaceae bacterium]|nr:helix-turn-helix domain-containing protein [Candidatus Polarisedimenticolaceae bacterium]
MRPQVDSNLNGSQRLGTYLRRLRTGYGYSLRRVEERARAEGGEIDNSQLSRYEKGICYPSFDKLRVLANVFNVSIQSFSDMVDLEGYEALKPQDGDPAALIEEGQEALRRGDNGRAFAYFERAEEMLLDAPAAESRIELVGWARVSQATALTRLGKLSLAEQELRSALRAAEQLSPALRARALLSLANIHADQGDSFLGEMEAERAFAVANGAAQQRLAAMALHTLARVLADQRRPADAIERFREAANLYAQCDEQYEAIRVRVNIGGCYVDLGKSREGIRLLRVALTEARAAGHRRLEAMAWSNLGEAYYRQLDRGRARHCLRESDALCQQDNEKQPDLLFFNAFYEWKMAAEEHNPTREKIAFGRLKALRSSLERRLDEVEEFDRFVEGGRFHD